MSYLLGDYFDDFDDTVQDAINLLQNGCKRITETKE